MASPGVSPDIIWSGFGFCIHLLSPGPDFISPVLVRSGFGLYSSPGLGPNPVEIRFLALLIYL